MPLASGVPATTAPPSRLPASTTAPAFPPTAVVITGASLVPVMVTSICLMTTPPCWSLSVMVKLSTLIWPAARYSTAESATV